MQNVKQQILNRVILILEKLPVREEAEVFSNRLLNEGTKVWWYAAENTDAQMLEEILSLLDKKAETEEERLKKRGILFLSDNGDICRLALEGGCSCIAYLTKENAGSSLTGVRYAIGSLTDIDSRYLERVCRRYAGLPWDILQTKRCLVREMTTEDVDSFYEIYKEPSITEYMEGLFARKEQEVEYVKGYIKNVYSFFEYGLWTVLEKESGRIIGRAGISFREETETVELGYVIGVPYQRQGYAYEVCSAILSYAEEELGMERIAAYIETGNEASKNLCRKMGFDREGTVLVRNKHYEKWIKNLKSI